VLQRHAHFFTHVHIINTKNRKLIDTRQDNLSSQRPGFLYEEKEKLAAKLIIANEELVFQNEEKENRAAELIIANRELAFQNEEKEKRAAELVIANCELVFLACERERRAEELRAANEELLAFTYISGHDLQEPLRKIQTFALLLKNESLSEKAKYYSDRIHAGAERMQQLIQDLLAYTRVNSPGHKFERIDLNVQVEEIKVELKETIEIKGATIMCETIPPAYVIPFQFRQVLYHLIYNALKFSYPGRLPVIMIKGEILNSSDTTVVTLLPGKKYCHISVQDNGIGFEPKYSDLIFEIFEKLHTPDEYGGTGIGLSIVKKIVNNHAGVITATSELDKGATFDIFIPDN